MMTAHRRRRPAGQAFYLTVFAISLLAAFSLLRSLSGESAAARNGQFLEARMLEQKVKECRFVHKVPIEDQCAYIRSNCPDEEAGLISYLQLYYCSLSEVKAIAFIILVIWISLLFSTIGIAASDFLCINLNTVASILGMSESLAGVTFLAFGNGSPDVFSTFAAMNTNSPSLAVGELFGAAGFITAVVAASMALVNPFQVARRSFVRDVGFFIVAASFSMVFLVDGKLQVWECAVMVAFYIFYVIFVVSWHWYLGRRRRRRVAEIRARLLYHIPQTQELDVPEHHDDSEDRPTHESTNLLADDEQYLSALEGAATPTWQLEDIGDDDETRDRYLADLRSGMHITLARRGERRSTITPIRPSLMGALEFRAALNTLHRKGSPTTPIDLRRYSNGRAVSFSQSSDNRPIRSHPELPSHHVRASEGDATVRPALDINGRMRAVSADNVLGLRLNTNVATNLHGVAETAVYSASPLPAERDRLQLPTSDSGTLLVPVQSPQLLISPPENSETLPQGPQGLGDSRSPQYLMPPRGHFNRPDYQEISGHATHSPGDASPMTQPTKPRLEVPKLILPESDIERNDSTSPFPMYTDSPAVITPVCSRQSSIHLPEPSISPQSAIEAYLGQQGYEEGQGESHKWGWWPYTYLPAPWIIASTLFPTVYGWHDKSIWDKLLGIVSAPSVLLLAATLPVVECEENEKVANRSPSLLDPANRTQSRPRTQAHLVPDSPHMNRILPSGQSPSHPHKSFKRQNSEPFSVTMAPMDNVPSSTKDWNRWLVFLQIFTAPLVVVTIAWANFDDDHDRKTLLILVLSSLVFSLVCLLLLLVTTTSDQPPKYRSLFCFLGFIVAIAWISTIANEVVCVLKAFGVILGISDAILGLTIFAVGSSLGDLVADITVAKLGYPVMALSACFGGPMLNILLGIGLSGLYVTIRHGTKYRAKHPNRPTKYKPFKVEVSTTLVISGVTLLTTLVGLLIVVPLNGWRMDRKVGWGLIALWSLSTIGNVVVEILGYGGDWFSG